MLNPHPAGRGGSLGFALLEILGDVEVVQSPDSTGAIPVG